MHKWSCRSLHHNITHTWKMSVVSHEHNFQDQQTHKLKWKHFARKRKINFICVSIIPIFVYLWRKIQKMGKFRVFLTWEMKNFPIITNFPKMGIKETSPNFPRLWKFPTNGPVRYFFQVCHYIRLHYTVKTTLHYSEVLHVCRLHYTTLH